MIFERYVPGEEKGEAYEALFHMMQGVAVGSSYADMIRLRLSGALARQCQDTYYVARDGKTPCSRHWNGWGKHKDAIGNWGNFFTAEAFRGQGIGAKLLAFWEEDFKTCKNPPLCFLCSAATKELTSWYGKYGFVVAIEGTEFGSLYKPVGDSPATFREFYRNYYQPSETLIHKKATVEYRHEIDCLLRFAFKDLGLKFGFGEQKDLESVLLTSPSRAGLLFSGDGHCVGWSFDGAKQVFPLYEQSRVEE